MHALSGSDDRTVKLFNVNDGAVLRTFKHHTHLVLVRRRCSPTAVRFVSGSGGDKDARIVYIDRARARSRVKSQSSLTHSHSHVQASTGTLPPSPQLHLPRALELLALLLQLVRDEGGVLPLRGEQRVVRPLLDGLPALDHHNLVRVDDGREAVGHQDDGVVAAPDQRVERPVE